MRHLFPLICLLALPLTAHAGGDYTPAQISQFSGSGGHYQFIVTQQGDRLLYNDYCRSYRVLIEPRKRTLRDIMLPFLSSNDHPEPHETEAAAQALQNVAAHKRTVHFGYMGGGLFPDKRQKCLYHGTGMELHHGDIFVHQDAREGLYPYLDGDRQPESSILPCCFGFAETCFIRFQAASSNS